MDLVQIGEIKQAIVSLTNFVTAQVDSTDILVFGELKQALEALTSKVTSAMEVSQLELHREEMGRDGAPDQAQNHLSPLDRARTRVQHILSASTYTHPICLRCGGTGHLAVQCCNSIVCFACDKTGHRSRNCREIAKPLKLQQKPDFDNNHRVLSITMNFHTRRGGECQKSHNSQWIWKRKENQEQRSTVHQKQEIGVEHDMNGGCITGKKGINAEMTAFEIIPVKESFHRMEESATEERMERFQPHLEVVSENANSKEMRMLTGVAQSHEEWLSDTVKTKGNEICSVMTCAEQLMYTPLSKEAELTCTPLTTVDVVEPNLALQQPSEGQKKTEELKEEKIKVKNGKNKKKKKGENKKKWSIVRDEQGSIVVQLI